MVYLQISVATTVSETMLPGRGRVPIVFSLHPASSLDLADQPLVGIGRLMFAKLWVHL